MKLIKSKSAHKKKNAENKEYALTLFNCKKKSIWSIRSFVIDIRFAFPNENVNHFFTTWLKNRNYSIW